MIWMQLVGSVMGTGERHEPPRVSSAAEGLEGAGEGGGAVEDVVTAELAAVHARTQDLVQRLTHLLPERLAEGGHGGAAQTEDLAQNAFNSGMILGVVFSSRCTGRAATGRATSKKASQGDIDFLDGVNLHLLSMIIGAFEAAHGVTTGISAADLSGVLMVTDLAAGSHRIEFKRACYTQVERRTEISQLDDYVLDPVKLSPAMATRFSGQANT